MGLSDGEKLVMDLRLTDLFFSTIDLSKVRHLHTYLPRSTAKEPDTWLILNRLRKEYPEVCVVVPRLGSGSTLEHIAFEGPHQIATSRFEIPEPRTGTPVELSRLDVIVVPLLAADASGYRLGYGRGYYDKFLPDLLPNCLKVGLSYFDPVDSLPRDSWDFPLDALITPIQVHSFPSGN